MSDLTDGQREFIQFCRRVGRVKIQGNIRSMLGTGEGTWKDELKDLEERGLVERVAYGFYELTDEGRRTSFETVCESCGQKNCMGLTCTGKASVKLDNFF